MRAVAIGCLRPQIRCSVHEDQVSLTTQIYQAFAVLGFLEAVMQFEFCVFHDWVAVSPLGCPMSEVTLKILSSTMNAVVLLGR